MTEKDCSLGDTENFTGHRNPDQHHTTGQRAWSLQHSEWCYPSIPCAGCAVQMAEEDPCPHCDGTGIRTPDNVECPYCQGVGRTPEPTIGTPGTLHCEQCNGTGRTPENVETPTNP